MSGSLSTCERNWHAGVRAARVIGACVYPDSSSAMHALAASHLRTAGFYVWMEWMVDGLDYAGRIDIVAQDRAGGRVAIELDNRKPRRRSLEKLLTFDGFRMVGLRGVEWPEPPEGINRVIGLRVRQAAPFERGDRRTVNREIFAL